MRLDTLKTWVSTAIRGKFKIEFWYTLAVLLPTPGKDISNLKSLGILLLYLFSNILLSFIISGTGDVLEPEDGIIGIGSGGNYALAAAKVLIETNLSAEEVAKKSIKVASDICVFTNNNLNIEKI